MGAETNSVMGLFADEDEALTAVKEIKEKGWKVQEIHSPIPSDKLMGEMKLKKSKIGWFTLCGGVLGFFSGFSLAIFSATRWNLIVSGKPIVSWFPYFVIAFEFTILFAVIGNILGLLNQVGLPAKIGEKYDPACSGSMYGVLAESKSEELESLKAFFEQKGALQS